MYFVGLDPPWEKMLDPISGEKMAGPPLRKMSGSAHVLFCHLGLDLIDGQTTFGLGELGMQHLSLSLSLSLMATVHWEVKGKGKPYLTSRFETDNMSY